MRSLMVLFLLLGACATPELGDKGAESPLPDDKADSMRRPTEHGLLRPGDTAYATLSDEASFHAYEAELTDEATLSIATQAPSDASPVIDTVLYLYRRGDKGWGRYVARNDDGRTTLWSSLKERLAAGRYRILVKGYSRWAHGDIALTLACDGAGCAAPPKPCLFGGTYVELPGQPGLAIVERTKLTLASPLCALAQAQVVAAVRQSSHTDVTTAAEAFSRVDEGEINRVLIEETAAQRRFVAYEYGVGDNSYGAIFPLDSASVVAAIHDGDLYGCTILLP